MVKPCSPDKILNPKTNRCVNRNGLIGKTIQEDQAGTKVCKDDEILNPKTNRCVKKAGAIGKKLLSGNASVNAKAKGNAKVKANANVHGKANAKANAKGNVKANAKVKANAIDLSTCTNQDTLVMMEPLTDIDSKLVIQLSDGYCYDINEIAQSCISSKTFKNPFTNSPFNAEDIQLLIRHPALTKANGADLGILMNKARLHKVATVALYQKHKNLFTQFFQTCLVTALVCTSDYSNDFKYSQRALTKLSEVIDKFNEDDRTVILNLASTRGNKLEAITKSYGTTCIHKIGSQLCNIIFNQHVLLKKASINIDLNRFVTPVSDNDYAFVYQMDKSTEAISVYCPDQFGIRDTVRFGVIVNKKLIDLGYMRDIPYSIALKYFNEHVTPVIKQINVIHQIDLKSLVKGAGSN